MPSALTISVYASAVLPLPQEASSPPLFGFVPRLTQASTVRGLLYSGRDGTVPSAAPPPEPLDETAASGSPTMAPGTTPKVTLAGL